MEVDSGKSIQCSRYLWCLTLFMLSFPFSYLFFAALIFKLKSAGVLSLVLSPLFYLTSFAWIFTGIGIRKMQQWAWYVFILAMLFNTYLNALNLISYSHSNSKLFAFVLTMLIEAYVYMVVRKEMQVPYLFPKIRWWESGLAGMNHLLVEMMHLSSTTGVSTGHVLDISMRGCFIKTPLEFEAFEKITVRIDAFGHKLDLSGVVVWNADSTVTHPKGVGVKFLKMDRNRKRKLKIITLRFSKMEAITHEYKKISI